MAVLRWSVKLSSWKSLPEEWSRAMACIQLEERQRINQFVFWEDAALSLIGRLLLRAAVVTLTGVSNDVIAFERTDKGKPFLSSSIVGQGCGLALNVSHQGDYAVLAAEGSVARGGVGVDVMQCSRPRLCKEVNDVLEQCPLLRSCPLLGGSFLRGGIKSIEDFFTTMTRQFTKREWLQIKAPPTNQEQLKLFYRFWCLKESYIKAVGTGLSHGLQRLEFILKDNPSSPWQHEEGRTDVVISTTLTVDQVPRNEWSFEESFLDSEHCVAVATSNHTSQSSPPFTEVTVPFLLSKLYPSTLCDIDPHQWILQSKRPMKCF